MTPVPGIAIEPFGYVPILASLAVAAATLAALEVQIEGANGWAGALPTWRFGPPLLRAILNGKVLTGYHVFLWATLLTLIHLPVIVVGWSLALELTLLSSYMTFAVLWDALWFLVNPARLTRGDIWWFRRWIGPFPTDYYGSILLGALLALLRGALPEAVGNPMFGSVAVPAQHVVGWVVGSLLAAVLGSAIALVIRLAGRVRSVPPSPPEGDARTDSGPSVGG